MTPTEIMYEAAEEAWQKAGERHGYSGVVHGAAAVLRSNGFNVDGMELAKLFHDPLSDYHESITKGDLTFEQLAKAIDLGPRGSREVRLRHPFDGIANGRFPYPTDRTPEIRVDVSWMENEVDSHLKKEKIKKGSKRYKEFVAANASKVLAAAHKAAEKAKEKAQQDYEKAIKELDKYHDEAIAEREGYQRKADVRHAFIDAAGLPGDAKMNDFETKVVEAWNDVVSKIEEHAAYLESSLSSADPEAAALHALASREKLKPFTEAA